ncbi:MAG: right-handed parallel beta-helix repeat-containing protein [candidate division WOR-3 bacterium]
MILILSACSGSPAPAGRVFYVSPEGDNSNPGTREQPWATPGYGSRQLAPGDTLVILGGTYHLSVYDEDIITPPSGTQNAWITIRGERGKRPVLAGSENLLAAVDLSGKSYIRLENLEITSDRGAWFREGINATGGPLAHAVLKDLYIHHIDEFGIDIGDAKDLQIINCQITHCGFGAIGGPAGEQGGWRDVLIKDCELSWSGHYYQGGDGPGPYDRPDGFGIEASDGPVEIANTKAEHNYGDGIDSKALNTYIHECIVANNSCDGIKLWGGGSRAINCLIYGRGDGNHSPTPWSPIVISADGGGSFQLINITVDDSIGENYIMHVQYDYPDVPVNLTIRNAIFSSRGQNAPIFVAGSTNLSLEYCLFYMPQSEHVLDWGNQSYDSSQVGGIGPGNRYGDPRFISTGFGADGNYHLLSGSPAIDAGTPRDAPGVDLDGRPRPQGSGFDMGSYER